MKSHRHGHPLALAYIALTLAALLWFAFLLSGTPSAPYDPGQTLVAAPMVAEPMPAEEQSMHAEEDRIPSSVTQDILKLYDDGRVSSMRYDPRKQTWYFGVIGACGGQMPNASLAKKVGDAMRPWTNAPVEFEKGDFAVSGHVAPGFTIKGCKSCGRTRYSVSAAAAARSKPYATRFTTRDRSGSSVRET